METEVEICLEQLHSTICKCWHYLELISPTRWYFHHVILLLPAVGSIRENVSENLSEWLSVRRLYFSYAHGKKCLDLVENS